LDKASTPWWEHAVEQNSSRHSQEVKGKKKWWPKSHNPFKGDCDLKNNDLKTFHEAPSLKSSTAFQKHHLEGHTWAFGGHLPFKLQNLLYKTSIDFLLFLVPGPTRTSPFQATLSSSVLYATLALSQEPLYI
jgi:hypothetical protein